MAGELIMRLVKKKGVSFLPIDSEHSGLWQCLEGRRRSEVGRLILTSSGGPFLKHEGSLAGVTPESALRHPRWKMGPKISIDSATLMNKGLEVIEASNLFDMSVERIAVVIHPEAIVHALIEFVDGSHMAQLGITDMRLPIQYALSYPDRLRNSLPRLELTNQGPFRFFKPDVKRFPCLELGYEAKRAGGTMPAVLNAANEVAVQKFLNRKIRFTRISDLVARAMRKHAPRAKPTLQQILEADRWAREEAEALC
jgi:1-deoxy-D-xylulose-5-phosphate reductoisomerase